MITQFLQQFCCQSQLNYSKSHLKRFFSQVPDQKEEETKNHQLFTVNNKVNLLNYKSRSLKYPQNELISLQKSEKEKINQLVEDFFVDPHKIELYTHKSFKQTNPNQQFNYPRKSFYQMIIPLSTNPQMRGRFVRFSQGNVRIGRILELVDLLAGIVGYTHCQAQTFAQDITLVTACLDNVELFTPISPKQDIILNGFASFVGKTTIEVSIDIYQTVNQLVKLKENPNQIDVEEQLVAHSVLLFAARNGKDYTKSFPVPKLNFQGEADIFGCQVRHQLGARRSIKRQEESDLSLVRTPPTRLESSILHNFFTNAANYKNLQQIDQTKIETTVLMHSQKQNVHGKIFGGYLMRYMLETSWFVGYNHNQGNDVETIQVDDVQFSKPVDIGSAVQFIGRVCYVHGFYIVVQIDAIIMNPKQEISNVKTTSFFIIMESKGNQPLLVRPESYEQSILYLEGRRRLENIFNQ